MKMQSLMKYMLFLAIGSLSLTSCYEDDDFVEDNTTPTGVGSSPVSANTITDLNTNTSIATSAASPTQYSLGTEVKYELQFFSSSPIKEINLYETVGTGTKTKVKTYPYVPAFSKTDATDTLIVSYTVPQVAVGTTIRLDNEILNENALSVTRTVYIKTK